MKAQLAILPGDGIGPEVTQEAVSTLKVIAEVFGHDFTFAYGEIGGGAYDKTGSPLTEDTVDACLNSDAVLLGAVGGPAWDHLGGDVRPEAGLLRLRQKLDVYANLRPIRIFDELVNASPLKPQVLKNTDFILVRELTGGLYFGRPKETRTTPSGEVAIDTMEYKESEILRVVKRAFEIAETRRKKLTSVDKANVLETSRLWRRVVNRVHEDFPDVTVDHVLVDNAAMQLIQSPSRFDVIVTENTFGDILSDEAAMLSGSIGLLPSASLSDRGPGLYEPIHGSAPDIALQGKANPIAAILSAAMLLEHSLSLPNEARCLSDAVAALLQSGVRTADLAEPGERVYSTSEVGDEIRAIVRKGGVSVVEADAVR